MARTVPRLEVRCAWTFDGASLAGLDGRQLLLEPADTGHAVQCDVTARVRRLAGSVVGRSRVRRGARPRRPARQVTRARAIVRVTLYEAATVSATLRAGRPHADSPLRAHRRHALTARRLAGQVVPLHAHAVRTRRGGQHRAARASLHRVILSTRQLNRAVLARQGLLERRAQPIPEALDAMGAL